MWCLVPPGGNQPLPPPRLRECCLARGRRLGRGRVQRVGQQQLADGCLSPCKQTALQRVQSRRRFPPPITHPGAPRTCDGRHRRPHKQLPRNFPHHLIDHSGTGLRLAHHCRRGRARGLWWSGGYAGQVFGRRSPFERWRRRRQAALAPAAAAPPAVARSPSSPSPASARRLTSLLRGCGRRGDSIRRGTALAREQGATLIALMLLERMRG